MKYLAAKQLKKSNPNQFFKFHNNIVLDKEIQEQFVEPAVAQIIKKQEHLFERKVLARQEQVEDCSGNLAQNRCFSKTTASMGLVVTAGIHLGIYFILKASNVSQSTQSTFLLTMPLTAIAGICGGVFMVRQIASCLAHCCIPGVSNNITVDLNEIADEENLLKAAFQV
ncbi:hypothetical protein [Legionella spiritensis]|uniref:hypothetical protein n=1 Tax=Legionella spiritensis TaxID=452 RepID=UPI001055E177|nr:hypothetical protein [Legionella spiritensis]